MGLNDPQTKRDTLFGSLTRHVMKTQANLDKGAESFQIMPPNVQCNFTVKSKTHYTTRSAKDRNISDTLQF